ncbi:retrovirus-related pol polyprotein from transposon TNT 1-94 [Tanacetum coccineum]
MVENEPTSYREAVTSLEGKQWREAIKSEIESILQNRTWELVDLPPGCKALGYKWIFKKKMKADGTVDKYKARLVIQGFRQREGLDYFDTYSPVTRITSIRKIITPGQEGKVCRLVKSLYDLKQAPKQWHQKFDHTMLESGFKINECEKCVYVKDTSAGYVILCLYVDDMLIVGSNDKIIRFTKDMLKSKFDMKDMGLADVPGYAVNRLSRNTSNPSYGHWKAITRVLHYLRYSHDYGLHYDRHPAVIEGYSDANWISDIKDSRSTSGYVFTLGEAAISWKSSKQTVISKSMMESNFIALDKCGEEAEWLRQFVEDIPRQVCQVRLYTALNVVRWETDGESVLREALILDGHTKDILCEKGDSLLEPMTLIANARVEREKGVHGLDSCLANLDNAIDSLHKCKVKANDLGSLYFLQAQALCLRALSRYENCNSKKIIWCKQNFTEDIEKVLKLVTNTYFSELAAKYMCLSNYINKLFFLIIDVLMTEHDENDHGLIEKIISLCDPNCDVGMLWQFKSHHSHLKSELIDDYFAENCNFLMEEGGHSEEPERMVSNIAIKVTKSLKSRCRAAHFYYDQGERMLLMGKMTKALDHAREGCERRYHLLKENFELTLRDAKVYTFHMNHIVAARAWSISFEEFILAPNNSFICYLNSVHQEATILELIGDKLMAMSALEWGKCLLTARPSFISEQFFICNQIYRKAQDINEAKKELRQVEELRRCVSCKSCQLLLKLEIRKESAKQKRKFCTTWDKTSAMQEFLSIEVLLKMQLNAKPSRKGHKNSNKDYVFKDETSNALDVFVENICLVVSLSSLPSSESPMTLSMLFELVKRTEIKVVHATHIAELIYIISWVACTKGKSDGDFSIPSETIIATLKNALILSSETPELLKKVAQLLAIMYLPGYFNEPPLSISTNSLTQCHWACFFHELTVGCGVDYLVSLRLSKMLPWESMKELENQYIYRMPSVSSIFYTYQKCYKIQRKAVRDYSSYATLDPFDAYYVINPTGITYGEYCLSEWLKNEFRLEGICHRPVVKEISEILKTHNLFIYVGHGHGSQHISIDALAKLDRCVSDILMGCYSGLLELEGLYILKGAPICKKEFRDIICVFHFS